jgi:hypothetical protein
MQIENQPTSNKRSFKSDYFNLHLFHKGMMYEDKYGVMFGPTKGHAHPPITREQLKELADFINNYLENN